MYICTFHNNSLKKIGLISINFCHCAVVETASNSVVASKKRQTKSGGVGGRRQSPKSFTSARRKKTAEAEASSDSDQGYLNSLGFIFPKKNEYTKS